MRIERRRVRAARLALLVVAGASLAACGGGDGGGDHRGTVVLTTANRDAAAHAAAGGAIGLGGVDRALPASAVLGESVRSRVMAMGRRVPSAGAPQGCAVSGTVTETDEDRDNDGAPSAGDVITLVFDQCRDSDDLLMNGTLQLTLQSVGSSSMAVRAVATSLVADTGLAGDAPPSHHRTTIDGAMAIEGREVGTSGFRMTMTVQGAMQMRLQTPVFEDTVELADGFRQRIDEDMATGLVQHTHDGMLRSLVVGGSLAISTPTPLVIGAADAYPREGTLRALGKDGALTITATSATAVKLDLDSNDDGAIDATTTGDWDWLI